MRFGLSGFAIAFATLMGVTFSTSPGYAELYKWTDESGTVWFTDDPTKLPKESQGEFEKLKAPKKVPDSPPGKKASRPSAVKTESPSSAESYLKNEERRLKERKSLEKEISTLEKELSRARTALQRVTASDSRGYWYIINSEGGKARASYKDPGAIWSYDTWPAASRESRTKGTEERRRIESDISKMERDLESARKKLSAFLRSP